MKTERICPSCGQPLAAGAPQGLCPECLMKAGFGTGVAPEPGEPTSQPPFTPPPLAEMAKLFPQLEIVELLGRGGMGAVYKARQPALDRWVALKVLPPQSTARPGFAERFNREARALARLNHPNIVALHEFGQVGGMPYFVMEYVEGVTLRRLVQARRLEPREALKIVPQICEALQFAHDEGVVHRDIKPENILLDKKGRVKIADFGIAKIMGGTPLNPSLSPSDGERMSGRTGEGPLTQKQVLGTPNYMAPEQIEHPQEVDHRADIYSLGVVFYEMLTGELPLGKFAPPSRMVKVDVRLDEVVLQALEKEPERRYQTAAEFKTVVETISSSSVPGTGTAPSPARPAPTRSRLRAALIVGVLVWLFVTGTVTLMCPSWKVVAVISCPEKSHPGRPVEEHFKFIASMIELIRSDVILGRVIDRLELDERSGKLDERWGKRNLGLKLTKAQAMVLLKRRLDVRSEGGTLIQVGVFGKRPEKPEEAIDIANTIAEELRAFRIEQHDPPADMIEMTLRGTLTTLRLADILLGLATGFVLGLLAGGLVLWRGFSRRGSQASQVKKGVETIVGGASEPPGATPDGTRRTQGLLETPPRFPRTAIVGACWVPLFFAAIAFLMFEPRHIPFPYGYDPVGALLIFLSLAGFFATTILGWIAVSQIRRSAGRLYGMWLAVFDGLLFPLLALDGLIGLMSLVPARFWAGLEGLHDSLFYNLLHMVLWLVVPTGLIAWVDYLIARRVWRAVSKPLGSDGFPATEDAEGRAPSRPPSASENADLEDARAQVNGPAIGLIVASVLHLLLLTAGLFIWTYGAALSIAGKMSPVPWIYVIPLLVLWNGCAVVTLIGALRMKQLRSYQLAVVGSVLAMFSGCLGLPIGIWSLIVLSRREVREAFKADGARPAAALGSRARTGFTGWKIVGMVVVLMLLVTGILIFLVAGDCYLQQRNATPKNSAGTVHTDLARELLARGKLAEATEQYQEALRLAPDDARAHQGLANVLARMGRREEAIQQLREAVRLKPDYEQAKERLRELETSVKSSVGAKSQSQAAFGPGGVTSSAPPAAEQELSSGPAITRVVAGANKAVVEGRGSPDVKLVIRNGKDGYLTCGFLNDSPFTATIERATWGRGINCVVKDLRGNVLLTLGNGKVGPMTTERGRIVFREGTLASEPDGSFILGEFRPETGGAALPITVRLKKLGTSSSGSAIERVKTPPPDADQAKPGEPTEKEPSVR